MSRPERKEISGNEDQRYVTADDHDAAKRWFEKQARAHDKRWTKQDKRENLRKLSRLIGGLDTKGGRK